MIVNFSSPESYGNAIPGNKYFIFKTILILLGLRRNTPNTVANIASPFAASANQILSSSAGFLPNQPQYNNVPPVQNGMFVGPNQPQTLEEIYQLRARYLNGGGQDPNFLKNLENLENFYKNLAARANTQPAQVDAAALQFQEAVHQKEQENLKLRHELELMKLQNEKVISPNKPGNFTLADMNLKMNGIDGQKKNGFNIYSQTNEFFVQNEPRAVDLNDEERMVVGVNAQEVDALRLLGQLPIGTELYRFKMEQFKELSTTRAEMEKIVQEQRLLKMRRDFEKLRREEDRKFENEKWVDEQRKNIIANRLRKDLNPTKTSKGYDPTEGLVIHWDYLLSVPKKNDSCQIVYGIYINGNEVYPPSMIEPHACEVDTSVTNRCIFGQSHPVSEIPANANALLIFEVQLFPSKDSTNPRLTSFGWSQLDLFDARRELK